MQEITLNLHMHTPYSDGTGSHSTIAAAALKCGLDAVIITDHNILVDGVDRYVHANGRQLLVLAGEEVHDRSRHPQKNHLLILGANQELAPLAEDTRALIKAVKSAGGLAFIAHPIDPAAPAFHEPDISWEDWSVDGTTGIELWNGFSELKSRIPTKLHGIFYAFFPSFMARGPAPDALSRWDQLLAHGPVVAIGGSDAHALRMRLGPLRRTVFPYEYHFRAVNTHILLEEPLTGKVVPDSRAIYRALAAGSCFIGYDLAKSTRGFRFAAYAADAKTGMGGTISTRGGVALHARVPDFAEIRLLRDGEPIHMVECGQALTHRALKRGVYRVETFRPYRGRRRAWILSNPIYVT